MRRGGPQPDGKIELLHGSNTQMIASRPLEEGFPRARGAEIGQMKWFRREQCPGRYGRLELALTSSLPIARSYAVTSTGGGDGVVYGVRVDPRFLRADVRAYDILNEVRKRHRLSTFAVPARKDWRGSLEEMGSVVYLHDIPPEDVRVVETIDRDVPTDRRGLTAKGKEAVRRLSRMRVFRTKHRLARSLIRCGVGQNLLVDEYERIVRSLRDNARLP